MSEAKRAFKALRPHLDEIKDLAADHDLQCLFVLFAVKDPSMAVATNATRRAVVISAGEALRLAVAGLPEAEAEAEAIVVAMKRLVSRLPTASPIPDHGEEVHLSVMSPPVGSA